MSSHLSRRSFVQTSLSAAALAALRPGKAYAANEKVRLAWIGVGARCIELLARMHKFHADKVETIALCDIAEARIGVARTIVGDKPRVYTDYKKMLDQEKPDAVLIATWPNTHAEISAHVLQAGYHCFCEKPLDTTVEKIDAITKVARQAKCIYQVGTQRRYHPGYLSAMPKIVKGAFGPVTFMDGHWRWVWHLTRYPEELRGGMFLDQTCHHLDTMIWAMGEKTPMRVVGMGYNQDKPEEGPRVYSPSQSATTYQWDSGQLFVYTHQFCLPPHFQDEQMLVYCEKGCADLPSGRFWPLAEQGKEGQPEPERIGIDSEGDWNLGTVEELGAFVDNVRGGGRETPAANIETARRSCLMGIMGRMAMIDKKKNNYEPRIIEWKDLGTMTDPA